MRLPDDLIAHCVTFLDILDYQDDVDKAFRDRERLTHAVMRVWPRATRTTYAVYNCYVETLVNGKRHSVRGCPAIVYRCGTIAWYKNGKVHREDDKPARVATGISIKRCCERIWPPQTRTFGIASLMDLLDGKQLDAIHEFYRDLPEHSYAVLFNRVDTSGEFEYCDSMMEWCLKGELHRRDDKPSVISRAGTTMWIRAGKYLRAAGRPTRVSTGRMASESWCLPDGRLHRDGDLPAVVYLNLQIWYKRGRLHRSGDLPAYVEFRDGDPIYQVWYRRGKIHRDGDLPAVEYANGTREWYKYGRRHRSNDLPAVVFHTGELSWYRYGVLHRDGGLPAITSNNGMQRWFRRGKEYQPNENEPICATRKVADDAICNFWPELFA